MYVSVITLFCSLGIAAPPSLTYQGRIIKSDGTALEYASVSFLFQITDPAGTCVIYEEQVNGYNMSNSRGVFDTPIGLGARSWPVSGTFTVLDSLKNSGTLACFGGATYTPVPDDSRKLRVQFFDGVGWNAVSPDNEIRSVPYAGFASSADKLGTNVPADFILKTGVPTCTAGTFLSWSGTALTCEPVSGSSGGTVTGVSSANAYVTIVNGTSTPQLTLNVGSSSGTVAAGDDSRLTNARAPTGTAAGDLSGTYPNPVVAKIQGVAINSTAPTSGHFLKYNGTHWLGASIAVSDISGLSTSLSGAMTQSQFPASCAANQTLTYSSPSGTFVCSTIAITGAQVSGNIAGNAAAFTGSLAGDVTGTQGATSVDKIKGVPLSMTGNATGKVLTFDGTNWAPATDTRIANAIQNAGGAVSIASGLDAAKGAASVDGRIFIATDTQKIYRDNGASLVVIASVDTPTGGGSGTVTEVLSANTDIGISSSTTTPTLTLNSGVGASQILKLDTSSRIPAVNGSLITNLDPANLSAVVPVSKGGTGQSSFTDSQILVGNSTGNTLSKQFLSGDAAMTNAGVVTVNGVKGKTVSAAPSATGQVLRYDGTNWTPNFISMFDLRSTVTGAATFGSGTTGCTAGQTLTWTAATDNLACTNIAISMSQISSGTLAVANGGTGVTSLPGTFVLNGGQSGAVIAGTSSADSLTLNTSGTARVTIASGGNVGIGTSGPTTALDINGTVRVLASVESASTAAPSGATYTIPDITRNIRRITLDSNTTLTLPSATSLGANDTFTLTIKLAQDATGSRTVAWAGGGNTIKWDSGTAPTIASGASQVTIVQFTMIGGEAVWYASMVWKEN